MDCDSIRREHVAEQYLLGSINEDQRLAFEQHYFQCNSCFEELRQLDEIRQALATSRVQTSRLAAVKTSVARWWQWPAFAAVAGKLGAGEAQLVAQRHRQRLVGQDVHAADFAVDRQRDEPLDGAHGGLVRRAAAEQEGRGSRDRAGGDNALDEGAPGRSFPQQ